MTESRVNLSGLPGASMRTSPNPDPSGMDADPIQRLVNYSNQQQSLYIDPSNQSLQSHKWRSLNTYGSNPLPAAAPELSRNAILHETYNDKVERWNSDRYGKTDRQTDGNTAGGQHNLTTHSGQPMNHPHESQHSLHYQDPRFQVTTSYAPPLHNDPSIQPASFNSAEYHPQHSYYLPRPPDPLFQNTQEVNKMYHNVLTRENESRIMSHRVTFPASVDQDAGKKPERSTREHRDAGSQLSLDEDGIMWDKGRYQGGRVDKTIEEKLRYKESDSEIGSISAFEYKSDYGGNISDLVYNSEGFSHEESDDPDALLSTSKKKLYSRPTKAKMSGLEKQPVPLGDKIEKLLTSLGPNPVESAARQQYAPNTRTPYLPREGTVKKANEYTSTDTSRDSSPLHKAKAVQQRLENLRKKKPAHIAKAPSSITSRGFEVNREESNLSSSSYASLRNVGVRARASQPVMEEAITPVKVDKKKPLMAMPLVIETKEKPKLEHAASTKKTKAFESEVVKNPWAANSENSPPSRTDSLTDKTSEQIPSLPHDKVDGDPKKENDVKVNAVYQTRSDNIIGPKSDGSVPTTGVEKENTKGAPLAQKSGTGESALSKDKMPAAEKMPSMDRQSNLDNKGKTNDDKVVKDKAQEETIQKTTVDPDLKKYTEAHLSPAQRLQTRVFSVHESLDLTSSGEEFLDEMANPTDTSDLEKLATPGHIPKGLVVRKKVPIKRQKKNRKRPPLKKTLLELSMSSGTEDMDDEAIMKRLALQKLRIVLFRVFFYLDTKNLMLVAEVCREWCKVSRHPALWRHISLCHGKMSSQEAQMHGLRGRGARADETPEDHAEATRGSLEQGLEKFLFLSQDTLTTLHIEDCDNILTDKCLWLVSAYSRLLTKLTYRSRLDHATGQLMFALGGGCPGLTSLFVHPLQPCAKVSTLNNRCLLQIAQFYRDLEEIGLGGKEFDMAGLLPLVQTCQHLRTMHFDHCQPMTADLATALTRAGLKNLKVMVIQNMSVEPKALQTFQGNCRHLQKILVSLTLEGCVEDPTRKKDKDTYKKMVKVLEGLKTKAGLSNIFTLEAVPVD